MSEEKPSLRVVYAHVRTLRKLYVWVLAAYAALCVVVYGYTYWLPTFLIRSFDLSVAQAGQYSGVIVLATGIVGPLAGGFLADGMHRRYGALAGMRLMAGLGVALAVATALTFQAVSFMWVFIGCIGVNLLVTAMMVLTPIALQMLAPSRMRGQMTGIALMVGNVVGQGIGPTGIGFLSDAVFPAEGLRLAMAVLLSSAAVVCAAAAARAFVSARSGRLAEA
jgi:sugar phosphate permease